MRPFLRAASVALVVAAACSAEREPVQVAFAPTILAPEDVLTNAATVTLVVYDTNTGAGCDAKTGIVTGMPSSAPLASSALTRSCMAGSGGTFCGQLMMQQSSDTLVFGATALTSVKAAIAYGCTVGTVNESSLTLNIKMIRNVPTPNCGDGVIEPTEQCDPPPASGATDLVCDAQCHSQEETLSTGSTSPQGPAFFLWPAQSGKSGDLFAFYTDQVASNPTHSNVALRGMSDALEQATDPPALAQAMLAPNDSTNQTFPPVPIPGNQTSPVAAFVQPNYYYAFADTLNGDPDIHLRSFDASLATSQSQNAPIGINGTNGAGESNAQDSPTMAVNGTGVIYVAWRDLSGPNAGQVVGRTYDSTKNALGTETPISTGSGNEHVQVAGTSTGWVAVWDNGAQIFMRPIEGNGTPYGTAVLVSTTSNHADHPGVAALNDDRVAVVWAEHGTANGTEVFAQRYTKDLAPVAGDQDVPVNDLVSAGDQDNPAIAGTTAAGGSFVLAWVDEASGHVRGRILDGSTGFDFNPVDGSSDEFKASLAEGPIRENPVVAVGGSQPWIAIGWDVAGVVMARRFPTVTQAAQ
jgi:hypothetical protein